MTQHVTKDRKTIPTQARVVIIGGGMMGVGLLYHLAEAGWKDVVLVEKGELTSGSTWHAAGQCPSFIANYTMAKIHDYGLRLYPRLEELTGQYVGWHGCGGIRFATKPEEIDWFKHVAGVAKLIGFECEIIDPGKIRQLNPFVTLDGVLAGAWTTEDGHVDPAGCCNALAHGARNMGARISLRNRVLDIKQKTSGDWQVITEQGTITCELVVNAAGCYARQISQMVGTDLPITNMKHTYIVTDTVQEFLECDKEMPVMRDPYPSSYYRQEQKSALIGIYETQDSQACWTHRDGWPEWDSENELFEADLDNLTPYLERVMERVPIWSDLGIKRVICGAIPHTPDGNPLLGPASGLQNFWQCNGASIGIAAGAGCGKYLAQWMMHGDSEINMAELDPRRFARHAPGEFTRARSHQDYEHMYALHLPGEERPAARKARTSSLYDRLLQAGCVYTEANGWERPKWFSLNAEIEQPGFRHNNIFKIVAGECRAVRERVGVLDLSSFAKFMVEGRGAEQFLNRICANRMSRRKGGIILAHYLSDEGRINGESTITRLGDESFYVLSGTMAQDRDYDLLTQAVLEEEDVQISNITDDWGTLVVAGPKSRQVLTLLTSTSLKSTDFPWLSAQEINVAGCDVRALRVNYVGELGWELHCPMSQMLTLYNAVWNAGVEFNIANFGVYCVNSLRMEKAYKGWGTELTNEITLIEAGMERFFAESKSNFSGKLATLKIRQNSLSTHLVYFEVKGADSEVRGSEPIWFDKQLVGVTTSGGYGHYTGKNLGFAYIKPDLNTQDCRFTINLLGVEYPVTLLKSPVWDSANTRLRD